MTFLQGGVVVVLAVPITLVAVWALHRRGWSALRLAIVAAFAAYLSGVAMQTLFPVVLGNVAGRSHIALHDVVHLRVLEGVFNSASTRQQAFLNVVLGIPFGVLVPLLGVRSVSKVLVLGLLFALSIEGLQLVEDVVYRTEFRTADINDVLLNWLGVAIGLAAFVVAATAVSWWPWRARGELPGPS